MLTHAGTHQRPVERNGEVLAGSCCAVDHQPKDGVQRRSGRNEKCDVPPPATSRCPTRTVNRPGQTHQSSLLPPEAISSAANVSMRRSFGDVIILDLEKSGRRASF